jgi:hypothetical protein
VKAIRAAKLADDKDPQADEALGVILDVMRRPSRYALARLAAARELLDRRRGRPMQGIKLSGKLTLAQLLAGDDEDNPTDGGSD